MRKKIYIGAFILLIIDLVSKFLVSSYVSGEITIINNFFDITFVKNTGGAFSLFSSFTYVLAVIGIVVVVYLDRCYIKNDMSKLSSYSMIFLMAGISGNLIDRIVHGYVIDFFKFNIFGYGFPVFNVADICICIGAVLLIIDLFGGSKK